MIFIAAAIDGSTKSRAREIPRRFEDGRPAPGPLRSEVYPDGLPHLSGRDAQRVDTDNKACNYMSSQRSKSCETVGEGVSVRTQPVHSIGGLRLRWRCGSPDNGWTRPTQCARWVALVASIKYFGTTWRRFSSGPRSANCHVTYMTRKSGRQRVYPSKEEAEYTAVLAFAIAVSASWWAVRKGLATLQVPRMPAFLPVGRREHWLDMDPHAMREWALAPLAVTLGLTEALRAGRPGLPVMQKACDGCHDREL